MKQEISILVAGDFCMHDRMQNMDASQIVASMCSISPIVAATNYSILNLECSVTDRYLLPIEKCGVNLKNASCVVDAIKELGFNGVTLANNHFADFGPEGVADSLEILSNCGLDYFGGGNDISIASRPAYVLVSGVKFAIISCCEHEFTIAGEHNGGSNPLDLISQYHAIQEAKKMADYVLVIVHGGTEFYNLPTPRMQDTYRFFIDLGVDAVINHHQHCYSGYEYYKGKPIVYGLGNFCFDWNGRRSCPWNEGYMARMLFRESDIKIELIPYHQCDEQVGVSVVHNDEKFFSNIRHLNAIINDRDALQNAYGRLIKEKQKDYVYTFNLEQNRTLRRLAQKHLLPKHFIRQVLPNFLDSKRTLWLENCINCESHRDLILPILRNYRKEL